MKLNFLLPQLDLSLLFRFCKERAFNERQTSTFLSIMNEIMLRDAELSSVGHSMEKSFDFFKEQVLKHSIEMPPRRSGSNFITHIFLST